MKISGFSFARNASKFYYPIKQSVQSILPIVDEFVIALGKGDDDDTTREELLSINDPKVKIIDTIWDPKYMKGGSIYAMQTDIAKNYCSGNWLFYLQADEVIHEKYHETIYNRCNQLLNDDRIEGLLFDYKHFWGDYDHYHKSHGWYPSEIRIIRNSENFHSWKDAQSFRYYAKWESTHQKEGTRKLRVALANAEVYHYGWVRPPYLMQVKGNEMSNHYNPKEKISHIKDHQKIEFDYGPLNRLALFNETHPKVMKDVIEAMNWKDKLQYSGNPNPNRELHRHETLKYRTVTLLEKIFVGGKQPFGFKNYQLIKNV